MSEQQHTPAAIGLSPQAYGVNDFCRAIGIGRSKVYELLREKKIRSIRIGKRRLIPAAEAERLLREGCSDEPPL
jgi:excisionase family DNA binding protein